MSDNNEHNWSNYWQGRNTTNQASSEALVGVENEAVFAQFWHDCFVDMCSEDNILDMACGAGSVLKHARNIGMQHLTGVDISKDAISNLEKNIPNVSGVVSAVDKTPFESNMFDMVVSQFGFEYAGSQDDVCAAALEMTRLVKKTGEFTALCHIRNGGIHEEVSGHLASIEEIININFIPAAKNVFKLAHAIELEASEENKSSYQRATDNLVEPINKLISWINNNPSPEGQVVKLAKHLYNGSIEMFNKRNKLTLEDTIGWLEGMSGEIQAYDGRMRSMQKAALSDVEANEILQVFKSAGFTVEKLDKLFLGNAPTPVAWILKAQR